MTPQKKKDKDKKRKRLREIDNKFEDNYREIFVSIKTLVL